MARPSNPERPDDAGGHAKLTRIGPTYAGVGSLLPLAGDHMSEPEPDSTERETDRIEAFSDGVFAIAITLLILEIKVHARPGEPDDGRHLLCSRPNFLLWRNASS